MIVGPLLLLRARIRGPLGPRKWLLDAPDKAQPGKSADMMRDFAKQFVWSAAMVKGLIAGIAESKDAEQAEAIFQQIVDSIARAQARPSPGRCSRSGYSAHSSSCSGSPVEIHIRRLDRTGELR